MTAAAKRIEREICPLFADHEPPIYVDEIGSFRVFKEVMGRGGKLEQRILPSSRMRIEIDPATTNPQEVADAYENYGTVVVHAIGPNGRVRAQKKFEIAALDREVVEDEEGEDEEPDEKAKPAGSSVTDTLSASREVIEQVKELSGMKGSGDAEIHKMHARQLEEVWRQHRDDMDNARRAHREELNRRDSQVDEARQRYLNDLDTRRRENDEIRNRYERDVHDLRKRYERDEDDLRDRTKARIAEVEKENGTLRGKIMNLETENVALVQANASMRGEKNGGGDRPREDGPLPSWLEPMLERYGPMVMEFFSKKQQSPQPMPPQQFQQLPAAAPMPFVPQPVMQPPPPIYPPPTVSPLPPPTPVVRPARIEVSETESFEAISKDQLETWSKQKDQPEPPPIVPSEPVTSGETVQA